MLHKISMPGLAAGVVAWFLIMYFAIDEAACLHQLNCGKGDLFMWGIIAVGMLCPAFFVAFIFSFSSNKNVSNHDDS